MKSTTSGVASSRDAAAERDELSDRRVDRHILERILERCAVGRRIAHRDARRPVRLARQCLRDQRHSEFVGTRFDRDAIAERSIVHDRLEQPHIANVQPDGAGVVLTEHEPVERFLCGHVEQEAIDGHVARARGEVGVERRRRNRVAQSLRLRRLARQRRVVQVRVLLQILPDGIGGEVRAAGRHARRRETHHRAEHAEESVRTQRARDSQLRQPRACVSVGRTRNARRNQTTVGQHVGRYDERAVAAIVAGPVEPAPDGIGVAGTEVMPEIALRRRHHLNAGDTAEHYGKLRGHRPVVHRHERNCSEQQRRKH